MLAMTVLRMCSACSKFVFDLYVYVDLDTYLPRPPNPATTSTIFHYGWCRSGTVVLVWWGKRQQHDRPPPCSSIVFRAYDKVTEEVMHCWREILFITRFNYEILGKDVCSTELYHSQWFNFKTISWTPHFYNDIWPDYVWRLFVQKWRNHHRHF